MLKKCVLFMTSTLLLACETLPPKEPLRPLGVNLMGPRGDGQPNEYVYCLDIVGAENACARANAKTPYDSLLPEKAQQVFEVNQDYGKVSGPVDSEGRPLPERSERLAIINFDFDSAALTEAAMSTLRDVADAWSDEQLVLLGFTDDVGEKDYNDHLAMRRVFAARDYLVSEGFRAELMTALGKGLCCYVASNDGTEGRALNRRVEVHLPIEGGAPPAPLNDDLMR